MPQNKNNELLSPGSFNDFAETLDNISIMTREEIVGLYSAALAKYKESLEVEETNRPF